MVDHFIFTVRNYCESKYIFHMQRHFWHEFHDPRYYKFRLMISVFVVLHWICLMSVDPACSTYISGNDEEVREVM
jgi:fumarate reductase subunit C